MTKEELKDRLECFRKWRANGRKENPIELGLTDSNIDEMLAEAAALINANDDDNLNDNYGELTLNEYQRRAMETCMPSCENYEYMLLNLVGEVGELCGKIAKHIRKGEAVMINELGICLDNVDEEQEELLAKEIGDVLWQTSGVATMMNYCLEDIARQNLEKLASRKERGVIDGNGDAR